MKQTFFVLFSFCLAAHSCGESEDVPETHASKESYQQANVDDSRAISALCEGFSYALEQSTVDNPVQYQQGVSVRRSITGKFPFSVYFDFTGMCDDGVIRSGKITAKMDTVPWKTESKIELTYSQYSANGAKLTGVQNLTVVQADYTNAPRTAVFAECVSSVKSVSLIEVVDKDEWQSKWSGEQVWTWSPKQISITGNGKGTTRLGFNYNYMIFNRIEKERDCKYIGKGVEQMVAGKDTAILDFGECNRYVSLTLRGEMDELKLPF